MLVNELNLYIFSLHCIYLEWLEYTTHLSLLVALKSRCHYLCSILVHKVNEYALFYVVLLLHPVKVMLCQNAFNDIVTIFVVITPPGVMLCRKNGWMDDVSQAGYRMFGFPAESFGYIGLDFKNIVHVYLTWFWVVVCFPSAINHGHVMKASRVNVYLTKLTKFSMRHLLFFAVIWKLYVIYICRNVISMLYRL